MPVWLLRFLELRLEELRLMELEELEREPLVFEEPPIKSVVPPPTKSEEFVLFKGLMSRTAWTAFVSIEKEEEFDEFPEPRDLDEVIPPARLLDELLPELLLEFEFEFEFEFLLLFPEE